MNLFTEKRLVFQQGAANPELQSQQQPSMVEAGKEAVPQAPEVAKEKIPTSAENVSNEYKEKGKQTISGANTNLTTLENLQVGVK